MKYEIYIYENGKTLDFYKKAIAEYEKRLSRYCKISCRFIKKEKEWQKFLSSSEDYFFILPGNHSISSESFSLKINDWEMSGCNKVSFFIPADTQNITYSGLPPAGPAGVPDNSCLTSGFFQRTIHLSCFSMESAMSAMLLYEQIYRGYRILHRHPYHK